MSAWEVGYFLGHGIGLSGAKEPDFEDPQYIKRFFRKYNDNQLEEFTCAMIQGFYDGERDNPKY